jgi:hypothetical protein
VYFIACHVSSCTNIVPTWHCIGRSQGCSLRRFDDQEQCRAMKPLCTHGVPVRCTCVIIPNSGFVSLSYHELVTFMVFVTPASSTGSIFVLQCLPCLFLHTNCPHMVFMSCSFYRMCVYHLMVTHLPPMALTVLTWITCN